jgi:hypothetical protein
MSSLLSVRRILVLKRLLTVQKFFHNILDIIFTFSQDDANVVLVNWQRTARGQYSRAVSNAELVGRQVGKTLVAMVNMGTNASDIHVIGFSLGAQVAGFIGETLKSYGLKLGRITGKVCFCVRDVSYSLMNVCRWNLRKETTWKTQA